MVLRWGGRLTAKQGALVICKGFVLGVVLSLIFNSVRRWHVLTSHGLFFVG